MGKLRLGQVRDLPKTHPELGAKRQQRPVLPRVDFRVVLRSPRHKDMAGGTAPAWHLEDLEEELLGWVASSWGTWAFGGGIPHGQVQGRQWDFPRTPMKTLFCLHRAASKLPLSTFLLAWRLCQAHPHFLLFRA